MNDALFGRVNVEKLNAEFFTVSTQSFDLISRDGVSYWQASIRCWDIVIDRAEREICAAHFSTRLAQSIKRLRRRDLVNEVQIDVEESWFTTRFTHDMGVPEFVE
jgi:hypothetical protein